MLFPNAQASLRVDNVNVEDSVTLDILNMRMQDDVPWTGHMFAMSKYAIKSLAFLKRFKNTAIDNHTFAQSISEQN